MGCPCACSFSPGAGLTLVPQRGMIDRHCSLCRCPATHKMASLGERDSDLQLVASTQRSRRKSWQPVAHQPAAALCQPQPLHYRVLHDPEAQAPSLQLDGIRRLQALRQTGELCGPPCSWQTAAPKYLPYTRHRSFPCSPPAQAACRACTLPYTLAVLALLLGTARGQWVSISTIAGNGQATFYGNGVLAATAELQNPAGMAMEPSGNLVFADLYNQRVRRINLTSWVITTVAGTGSPSWSGDGGPATSATLNNPYDLCVASDGTIYIADTQNNRVRMIDTTGKISTIAGLSQPGYSGDGGQATAAALNNPRGVAVDSSNNLYISDYGNNRCLPPGCLRAGRPARLPAGTAVHTVLVRHGAIHRCALAAASC